MVDSLDDAVNLLVIEVTRLSRPAWVRQRQHRMGTSLERRRAC